MTKSNRKPGLLADLNDIQRELAPMMGTHYYSKFGIRISGKWWSHLYQDLTYPVVDSTKIMMKINGKAELVRVETVWNGVDDREIKYGPPDIFETKVETSWAGWTWSAHTLSVAQTVHALVVAALRRGEEPASLLISTPLN